MRLSDERTLGLDPRQRVIHLIEGDVNTGESRDLLKLLNRESVLNRYPIGAYTQRCYSYVPGVEAFPEVCYFVYHTIKCVITAFCVFDVFESAQATLSHPFISSEASLDCCLYCFPLIIEPIKIP